MHYLAVISIYAAFTFWQGWMTRKLIDNTSKQFQKDQRPYVWLSGYIPPGKIHIAKSEEMWLSIGWTNYGRSPALREAGIGKIFVGPNAMEEADKWFAGLGDNPLPGPPLKEIPIPPGISSDPDKSFGGFSTITTDHILTPEEVAYILATDRPVAMVNRVEYYDSYGKRYWSDLCLSRFVNGSIPHCEKHNEMH